MDDIYNFLMFDLNNISDEFDDANQAAHEVCLLLSVDTTGLPETFYRLYTSSLSIDTEIIRNATAFFVGAGFLNIHCDCEGFDKAYCDILTVENNEFYDIGSRDLNYQNKKWTSISNSLQNLREALA